MMTLVYEDREGRRLRVRECVPHPLVPGFYFGVREVDGQPVCVHEHRVKEVINEEGSTESRPTGDKG